MPCWTFEPCWPCFWKPTDSLRSRWTEQIHRWCCTCQCCRQESRRVWDQSKLQQGNTLLAFMTVKTAYCMARAFRVRTFHELQILSSGRLNLQKNSGRGWNTLTPRSHRHQSDWKIYRTALFAHGHGVEPQMDIIYNNWTKYEITIYIYAGFTTIPSVHLTLSAGSVLWCDLSGRQESSNPWHSIVDAEHFRDLQADLGSKWSQWSQWSMLEQCWTQCRTLRSGPFNSCFLVPGILKGGDFRCLQPLPQVLVNDVLDEANQRDRSVNVLGPVPWRD